MAKKRGLGKGLAALIPTRQVNDSKKDNINEEIIEIKETKDKKEEAIEIKETKDKKEVEKREVNKKIKTKEISNKTKNKEAADKETVKIDVKINDSVEKEKDSEELSFVKTIAIEKIDVNPDQPRKSFDEETLKDLSESIKKYGILQPIVVKKRTIPGKAPYEIIAGERRYRAAKLIGLKEVPVVLRETTEEDAFLSVIENIQREDLTPYEEALAYKEIMQDRMMTQQELADAMGKSRAYIANIIRLLKLDEASMEDLKKGLLTSSQARVLLSEPDLKKRDKYRKMLTQGTLNVNEIEKKTGKKHSDSKNVFLMDLENRLSETLETQVQIHKKQKGWAIQVICYTKEDMDRFLERLEK